MYRLHSQYFGIFLKSVKSAHFNEIVDNIFERQNCNLQLNILQHFTKILRQYLNCNQILEIFLTCFCNILCYVESTIRIFPVT